MLEVGKEAGASDECWEIVATLRDEWGELWRGKLSLVQAPTPPCDEASSFGIAAKQIRQDEGQPGLGPGERHMLEAPAVREKIQTDQRVRWDSCGFDKPRHAKRLE